MTTSAEQKGFLAPSKSVRFHRLPPPTDDDIRTLVLAQEQRMKRVLDRWRAAGAGASLSDRNLGG